MTGFKVALLQILPGSSLEENLEKGLLYCQKAKEMGADLALFPEMWNVGYTIPTDIKKLKSMATLPEGSFVSAFGEAARKLNMAVGITFLEQWEPLPRNTICIFDRFGRNILTYAKVHTCDFGEECRLTPGEDFYTAQLDTASGKVQIGAMICYDREFPESARILMLKGAELILAPNACPMEQNRICQLRGRAFENMTAIATVNYPKGKPDCNGHSTVFDGIAYGPEAPVSRDMCVLETGGEEGIFLAQIPVDRLRVYRNEEVHGNAYRRPEKYGLLTALEIREPFIRPDRRK